MTFGKSCLPPLERESHSLLISKAHILECQERGSSHWAEDLGCTRPPWTQEYSAQDAHRPCAWELYETRLWAVA